jgi:hypothetical protein
MFDRKSGLWNRSVLAGVRVNELLLPFTAVMYLFIAMNFLIIAFGLFLTDIKFSGSLLLLSVFYFLLMWCSIMMGLCCGGVLKSEKASTSFQTFLSNSFTFLVGECFQLLNDHQRHCSRFQDSFGRLKGFKLFLSTLLTSRLSFYPSEPLPTSSVKVMVQVILR